MYTSNSIAPVTVAAPGMSNRRLPRGSRERGARGMTWIAAISVSSATGAGTSRVSRQLTSVSRPERTSPSENPLAPNAE